jgi:hypothetical protein
MEQDQAADRTQDRLAITTYRLCYEVEPEGLRREWEFASEDLANIARNAMLLRYPSAHVRVSTAFFSSRVPRDRECYESRLKWLQQATLDEERLLSLSKQL